MLTEKKASLDPIQKLPHGICVYRGSEETRNFAPQIIKILEKYVARGDDLRFRNVEELYQAFDEKRCLYALDMQSKIVGFVFFNICNYPPKKPYIYNSSLIVDPSCRNLGLGKNLKLAVSKITEKECPKFDLVSRSSNPVVIQWNRELGYKEISYRELWETYGFDAIKDCANNLNVTVKFKKPALGANPFDNVEIIHTSTGNLQRNLVLTRS